ncbi:MAG: hypothetical protein AAGF90_10490, partial [Pseudomonadota bacterium]
GWIGPRHTRYGTVKAMAMRGRLTPRRGGHTLEPEHAAAPHVFSAPIGDFPSMERAATRFACPVKVHHFRWTASVVDRLRERLATPGVSAAGRELGEKQIDHFARHDGFDLAAVALRGPAIERHWRLREARLTAEGTARRAVGAIKARFTSSAEAPA